MSRPGASGESATLRVAVVGGGWAGLAAAVELSASGAQVTLFEAARQLGGRARSVAGNGHQIDNGQHILIGAYRETLRLMRVVGADPERLLKRLPLEVCFPAADFRLRLPRLPAPFNLLAGLLGARGCSFGEKLAAAHCMRRLQKTNFHLVSEYSVADWLDRNNQRGNLRRFLWEPLCLAAMNTPPGQASAQIFANVLRDSLGGDRAATDLLLPATDLDRVFPTAAAEFVAERGGKIILATRVDAVSHSLHVPLLSIRGETYDHVVIAVAPQHSAKLLLDHAKTAPLAELLATYAFEPIGTVYAGYPRDTRLPLPMLGLGGKDSKSVGQWVFDRGILGGEAGLISFVLSGHGAWEALDNAALLAALHRELEAALGRQLSAPAWHRIIRERRATFCCHPQLVRPSAQTAIPGLWLAGDYVCADYPATLEGAIRSGIAAARGIEHSQVARR